MVAAAREAASLYAIGWSPWRAVMQTFPEDVREAVEAFRPEQPSRPGESPDVSDNAHRWQWLKRLAMEFVGRDPKEPRIATTRDLSKCFALSRAVFTDAALEAARRRFGSFPDPEELRNFLIEWGEKNRPLKRRDGDRRHSSLVLTDQERLRLRTAQVGTPVPNGPIKRLSPLHVRIAQCLASWETEPPTHQQLAKVTGASVRTVLRALLVLRALRLLAQEQRALSRIVMPELPKQVRGFDRVMALIAAHASRAEHTRVAVKTLYRWEGDLRAGRRAACGRGGADVTQPERVA